MITRNPMQLKAYIKKKATEKHISAQLVMQNYMLERLLERISLSKYKNDFIIDNAIVNIGLHFILKNVRPYAASCSEA